MTLGIMLQCLHGRSHPVKLTVHVSAPTGFCKLLPDETGTQIRAEESAEKLTGTTLMYLSLQTGSGVHPASCPMGTWYPFPGGKARPGSDADHSPPSSAEVVNE
jgi:hypothetical protein